VQNLTIPDMLEAFWRAKSAGLRVFLVGRIESFDTTKQTATVKPLLQETSRGDTVALPVLQGVPVIFPGGGGAWLTFPVEKGNYCEIHFADRSLDQWKAKGGEVDPIDQARHALKDCVARVGIQPPSDPIPNFDGSSVVLGFAGGVTVKISSAGISLNGGSTPVAKVGSQVIAGPYIGQVTSGSSSVTVP
jgi:hypothetical protein